MEETLTIIIHLPQHHGKVTALLDTLDRQWPGAVVAGNVIEVAADEERR